MFFPFTIKFKKCFQVKLTETDKELALRYIEDFIEKKSAENIIICGNELTFYSNFFTMRWNTNIMSLIEKGMFHIINDENGCILSYEFFMYRFFVIVAIMSVVMGFFSKNIWVSFACFALLGGVNWVIAIIRHRIMFGNIITGIDSLISTNSEKEKINP